MIKNKDDSRISFLRDKIINKDIMREIIQNVTSMQDINNLLESNIIVREWVYESVKKLDDILRPEMFLTPTKELMFPNLSTFNILIVDYVSLSMYYVLISKFYSHSDKLTVKIYVNEEYEKYSDVFFPLTEKRFRSKYKKISIVYIESKNCIIVEHYFKDIISLEIHKCSEILGISTTLLHAIKNIGVNAYKIKYTSVDYTIVIDYLDIKHLIFDECTMPDKDIINIQWDDIRFLMRNDLIEKITFENKIILESYVFIDEKEDIFEPYPNIKYVELSPKRNDKINFFSSLTVRNIFPSAIIEVGVPNNLNVEFYFQRSPLEINMYHFISLSMDDIIQPNIFHMTLNDPRKLIIKLNNGGLYATYPNLTSFNTRCDCVNEAYNILYLIIHSVYCELSHVNIFLHEDDEELVKTLRVVLCITKKLDEVGISVNKDKVNLENNSDIETGFLLYNYNNDITRTIIGKIFPPILFETSIIQTLENVNCIYVENINTMQLHVANEYVNNILLFINKYNINSLYVTKWDTRLDILLKDNNKITDIIADNYTLFNMCFLIQKQFPNIKTISVHKRDCEQKSFCIETNISLNVKRIFPNAEVTYLYN